LSQVVDFEGRRLRVSSLDKVLWPEAGFTKGEMLNYYVRAAPALLPHLAGRPITLRRLPDGVDEAGWYQNDCPPGRPPWVRTETVEWPSGRTWDFCAVDDLPTLVWVANLGTIELHPFLALRSQLARPTAVVFDLDPGPPAGLADCCRVALRLRALLEEAGLAGFAKVSGALGLHVLVPLNTEHSWQETKAFARAVAEVLAGDRPDEVVDRQARGLRAGKVLVDWLQNDPTRSTVAPYSLRAEGWPTVCTPVTWEEIERAAAERRDELLMFEPAGALERVERLGDLFRPILELEQQLPPTGG
jgi:bifunctional non-homologous end joining protein LigD